MSDITASEDSIKSHRNIPVHNLWVLILYASLCNFDWLKHIDKNNPKGIEDNPDDIANLVAAVLCDQVKRRIKRNLTYGYQTQKAALDRIRGHIDFLKTERRQLLEKGKIFCHFDELTANTPRNRYVRSALEKIAGIVKTDKKKHDYGYKCRSLAMSLKRMGVIGEKPEYAVISAERFAKHDVNDRLMVTIAHLAFNLALLTESAGNKHLPLPNKEEEKWLRKLFEKAILGFCKHHYSNEWDVSPRHLEWQCINKTAGTGDILPRMETDITLDSRKGNKRIIIDTKFTSILGENRQSKETFKSKDIYQIYAYLMSQKGKVNNAHGMLLYPSIGGESINKSVEIQGYTFHFATVNLDAKAENIKEQLFSIIPIKKQNKSV